MGKARWHAYTKQKDTEKKKETDKTRTKSQKDARETVSHTARPCALSNPAVCLNSRLIMSPLWSKISLLHVCFLDLTLIHRQTQVRHQLKGFAGREQTELKAEIPTRTIMRKKYIFYSFISTETKQKNHRPAFGQYVWNFTVEPDLSCTSNQQ